MRVIVSRTGGLAGMRLTWQVSVDEQPDEDAWLVLIGELPWDDVPPVPPEPDRFIYRIACEQADADPPERKATLAERQLRGPWRELVDRVRDASDGDRRHR